MLPFSIHLPLHRDDEESGGGEFNNSPIRDPSSRLHRDSTMKTPLELWRDGGKRALYAGVTLDGFGRTGYGHW